MQMFVVLICRKTKRAKPSLFESNSCILHTNNTETKIYIFFKKVYSL